MNSILPPPFAAPHLLANNRLSPSRDPYNSNNSSANMSSRKRKASEEPDHDRMSTSPSASPSIAGRPLPAPRSIKRTRTGTAQGRPLALPRLLETLSADQMRQLLQNICDQHPELQQELVTKAPRPSIESTLQVLSKYEDSFRQAFPLGNRPTSDYSYNRVQTHLRELIDAVREYTPHFLPPHETADSISLTYLDSVTNMIHRLPDWDTFQHQRYKNEAYDEIAKAWALVIKEASKKAGGFHLQFGGWDHKILEHHQKSGGKMEDAVTEVNVALGFMQRPAAPTPGVSEERANIRQQLFSGNYGQQLGIGQQGW
ncbi:Putative tethering factor for nuclear proteasome Cut8/Sts1, Cut8/Sts1 superfamily [Septoria linicola]|uniref:Tethering factor for nuclear proteasome STS1 n=1 Tax=Septoria linicola TaxID=215465 RepID=A0A9Q9ER89_9PEZI|nr:putative tethering factor for nuclear proteasome Cut8/Sts1, Cut8/Sts1 superfamily [Septoria linicola]USW58323.1 Putative tethering factor for nuclear proteasome Cut8/Sts1, Cut8/Sts1 superfamily [Septoria linicola]